MLYNGIETTSIMPKLIDIFDVFTSQKTLRHDPIIKGSSWWRTVYQELGKLRPKLYQPIQFLRDYFWSLVIESDDHGSQNCNSILSQFTDEFMRRFTTLLAVSRTSSLVADPDAIYTHFQDFLYSIPTESFDA